MVLKKPSMHMQLTLLLCGQTTLSCLARFRTPAAISPHSHCSISVSAFHIDACGWSDSTIRAHMQLTLLLCGQMRLSCLARFRTPSALSPHSHCSHSVSAFH
eukprot:SAG31_NODE_14341_length_812_cov_1.619916_1_plen_101_part_10